jgi:NAD(P)-dependent dehydrogenase (short-subunit alcohol dehydrogenase family)
MKNHIYKHLARNSENGKKAVEKLKRLGLNPIFYELNVVDHFQVEEFAQFIGKTYGGVDILVNNAAVLYKVSFNEKRTII